MTSQTSYAYAAALALLVAGCAVQPTTDRGIVEQRSTVREGLPSSAQEIVLQAMALIGVPYRYGGSSPETGLDCSGLVRYVVARVAGVSLKGDARAISEVGAAVDEPQIRPGDLVFFNTLHRPYSHVGIYVGDGKFIHAPRRGSEVRVDDMHSAYWLKRFNGARRAVQEAVGATATRLTEAAPASP